MELGMFCKDRLGEIEDLLLGCTVCKFLTFLGKVIALNVSRLPDIL